jgi:tripartite-type tricarboxylate transporter receptor subunit TctC
MLSKALPGNPVVVVKNCPGGSGTVCSNQFAQMKNGDGLTILGDSGSSKFPFLLDDKRVKYNPTKWPTSSSVSNWWRFMCLLQKVMDQQNLLTLKNFKEKN